MCKTYKTPPNALQILTAHTWTNSIALLVPAMESRLLAPASQSPVPHNSVSVKAKEITVTTVKMK